MARGEILVYTVYTERKDATTEEGWWQIRHSVVPRRGREEANPVNCIEAAEDEKGQVRTDTRSPPEGERPRKAARGSSTENRDERAKPGDEMLCRDFMNKGTCWRGNTCRFSHDWAHAPSGKGSGKGKGKASEGKAK